MLLKLNASKIQGKDRFVSHFVPSSPLCGALKRVQNVRRALRSSLHILSNLVRFEHFRAKDIGCFGCYFGVILLLCFLLKMARPEGFEPPTPWFVARYSIQLSYGRVDWRRERDSNPRWDFSHTPLAGERLRPLGHLSNQWFGSISGIFLSSI
ncbi:hypothetical protein Lste_1525 [Legionella steelei]|uniref:Uncharacterized protein n=1 Tax=Legionella steelei TaxID=947033 RepID=A0A0W0ZGR2_9GAMM|nr:hypothetical protein Lste_1525 [Legionella steelei]